MNFKAAIIDFCIKNNLDFFDKHIIPSLENEILFVRNGNIIYSAVFFDNYNDFKNVINNQHPSLSNKISALQQNTELIVFDYEALIEKIYVSGSKSFKITDVNILTSELSQIFSELNFISDKKEKTEVLNNWSQALEEIYQTTIPMIEFTPKEKKIGFYLWNYAVRKRKIGKCKLIIKYIHPDSLLSEINISFSPFHLKMGYYYQNKFVERFNSSIGHHTPIYFIETFKEDVKVYTGDYFSLKIESLNVFWD